MRAVSLVLLCAAAAACEADVARCVHRASKERLVTLTPAEDGVVGRYVAQVCTVANRSWTHWELDLSFFEMDASNKCPPGNSNIDRPGAAHSHYINNISFEGNCSYVCLQTTLDMVWAKCYALENKFYIGSHARNMNYTYIVIKNNYTFEYFAKNRAIVDVIPHDDDNVTIVFHTGAPFRSYYLEICEILNNTRGLAEPECQSVEQASCASPSDTEVRCRSRLSRACYALHLKLRAPWDSGELANRAGQGAIWHTYCVNGTAPPQVGRAGAAAWWWGAGGALLVAASALLVLAARSRDTRRLQELVLAKWLALTRIRVESPPPAKPSAEQRNVLLLYAREGAVGARLVAALVDLLEETPGAKVVDVFAAESVAAAARGPVPWLRAQLRRPDTRVLVLQTPALAALYGGDGGALWTPLLAGRVAYRAPHFGDSLLQYALRVAADHSAHSDYRKYYVATLSGLETDILPSLVSYKRYVLPQTAGLLVQHLWGASPSDSALRRLEAAAAEMVDYIKDHTDYLLDEIRTD